VTIAEFTIPGEPQVKGNLRRAPSGGLYDSNRDLGAWANRAALAGHDAMNGRRPVDAPIRLTVRFIFRRPKSHKTGTGNMSAEGKRSAYPATRSIGDLDKLERAIGDALTGVIWTDDARIVQKISTKVWGDQPGVELLVEPASPSRPPDDTAGRHRRLASGIGEHADDLDTTEHLAGIIGSLDGYGTCTCGRIIDPLHRFCSGCGRPTFSPYAQTLPPTTEANE
jgi:crossover junction endodeoxyribonuclease RusA